MEPKRFLRGWSGIEDDGVRAETLVACHLLRAADTTLSPALAHFQRQTQATHAFQAVPGLPFEPVDCFSVNRPAVVPARTILSQLL